MPLILAGYGGESLLLSIEYDPQSFAAPDMDRLMGHLVQMLDAIAASPMISHGKLRKLVPELVQQIGIEG